MPTPSTDPDFIPYANDVIELENGTQMVVLAYAVATPRDIIMAGMSPREGDEKGRAFFSLATTAATTACDGRSYLLYAHYFSLDELSPKPVRVIRRGIEVWVDKIEEVVM